MLTKEQEKWVSHLSNEKIVEILPYNPKTKESFYKIKKEIEIFFGKVEILHCGSTSLGILGQGEVDLYIPVNPQYFNEYLKKLIKYFGPAGSIYPLERARLVKYTDNIKVEIFLINKDGDNWKNSRKFENYLKNNLEMLNEYVKLKEESRGLSVQYYYRKKIEFINKVLELAK